MTVGDAAGGVVVVRLSWARQPALRRALWDRTHGPLLAPSWRC
jgi:hypothetical protein